MFKLKENNTSFRTELVAGLTTFMAMAYILAVNPNILSATGMNSDAILLATALASFVGCMAMALLANYPFALAPGMGLNAYMAFTVCGNMGYSWQIALLAVFVEGLIFIVLSLTNVREAIFNAIPMALKKGVSAGIDRQSILHSSHVGGAADPGSVQSCGSAPDGLAAPEGSLEDREADEEAECKSDRAAKEDRDHASGKLGDLAEVAAQQHDEDHCVQKVILQYAVSGTDAFGIVQAQGTEDHVENIDPYQRRDPVKDFPLGVFFHCQQPAGQEHQECDESKTDFNSR